MYYYYYCPYSRGLQSSASEYTQLTLFVDMDSALSGISADTGMQSDLSTKQCISHITHVAAKTQWNIIRTY